MELALALAGAGGLRIEDEGGIRGRGRIGFGAARTVVSTLEIVSLAAEGEADPSSEEDGVGSTTRG